MIKTVTIIEIGCSLDNYYKGKDVSGVPLKHSSGQNFYLADQQDLTPAEAIELVKEFPGLNLDRAVSVALVSEIKKLKFRGKRPHVWSTLRTATVGAAEADEKKSVDKMNKDELIATATEMGIKLSGDETKAMLVDKITAKVG